MAPPAAITDSVYTAALLVTYLLAVRPSRCGSPPSHAMGMAAEDSIMSKNPDTNSADRDAEIEREIQTNRKFSLSEAIGRMAGGLMKGGSPVTRKRQAELEIDEYLRRHLVDSGGVLRSVLLRQLGESLLNGDYDQPLAALAEYIRRILTSEALLEEFVREADAEWGRVQNERPYFQRPSRPPHPDDPYTIDSVRLALFQLRERLASGEM
jgi:hypothetical protein